MRHLKIFRACKQAEHDSCVRSFTWKLVSEGPGSARQITLFCACTCHVQETEDPRRR